MKAFTDLEQSKKLAKILPIYSADMFYTSLNRDYPWIWIDKHLMEVDDIPCWSLAALLSVLPFHFIINNQRYEFSMNKGLNKDGETYKFRYNVFNTDMCLYSTDYYNNPIDAAFEMICWLKENKKL